MVVIASVPDLCIILLLFLKEHNCSVQLITIKIIKWKGERPV